MKNNAIFLVVVYLFILSAMPKTLNYQGKLLDSDGVGLNTELDITFKLYDSAEGGMNYWEKTINDVSVSRGLFSVELTDFPDSVDFNAPYWLEITIGEETMFPREKLTAVPYAFYSETAGSAPIAYASESNPSRRSGSGIVFAAGDGATLSDTGGEIRITLDVSGTGGTSGTIPSIYDVLIAGDNAGGYGIHNLLNPEAPQDVATKAYVDDYSVSSIVGGNGIAPNGPSMGDITLDINVDNSSVEIYEDTIRVKASGIASSHIADGTITSADIGSREVQSSNIAVDNILREHIIADAVGVDEIADNAVGYNHLADFTVTSPSQGDVFYYDGSQWINLGIGSAGQMLAVRPDGTSPYWETPEARAVFNFQLTTNPSSGGVQAGDDDSTTVKVTGISGDVQSVTFYTTDLPTDVTHTFTPTDCTPSSPTGNCTTKLKLMTQSTSSRGTYPVNITGVSSGGNQASATYLLTIATIPGAISDLTAEVVSGNVVLNWTAPSDNGGSLITNYIIYRATSPNPTDSIDAVGSVLTYTDTGPFDYDTRYYYRITALNAIGTGQYSNQGDVLPFPTNCKVIMDAGLSDGDGIYTIDPDGAGSNPPINAYCDMTTDGGGWTLIMKTYQEGYSNSFWTSTSDVNPSECENVTSTTTPCKKESAYNSITNILQMYMYNKTDNHSTIVDLPTPNNRTLKTYFTGTPINVNKFDNLKELFGVTDAQPTYPTTVHGFNMSGQNGCSTTTYMRFGFSNTGACDWVQGRHLVIGGESVNWYEQGCGPGSVTQWGTVGNTCKKIFIFVR